MKIVREHINEKFTQDSDPIADMNIGMMHQIKLWMESIGESFKDKDNALIFSAEHGKLDFVEYLLDVGTDVHANDDSALRWASQNGHTEVVKVLLAAGADVHADDDNALRWASKNGHTEVVKILKDHITKEKRKKVKESVNEKFTQDSDPIKDLSIGINVRRKFNTQDEMYNWLSYNLQGILDPDRPLDDILTDILNEPGETGVYLGIKYYSKLTQYANQYLSSMDRDSTGVYPEKFHLFLKNKYPHIKSWIIDGEGKY